MDHGKFSGRWESKNMWGTTGFEPTTFGFDQKSGLGLGACNFDHDTSATKKRTFASWVDESPGRGRTMLTLSNRGEQNTLRLMSSLTDI